MVQQHDGTVAMKKMTMENQFRHQQQQHQQEGEEHLEVDEHVDSTHDDVNLVGAIKNGSSNRDVNELPEQHQVQSTVSLSSPTPDAAAQQTKTTTIASSSSSSRYFVPYRTIGVVCSGTTFDIMHHQNSAQSIVAVPIHDRFQLIQTDKLHPILISQTITTPLPTPAVTDTSSSTSIVTRKSPERSIQHIISDPTLSITIVSHGLSLPLSSSVSLPSSTTSTNSINDTITLYHRTRPIQSININSIQHKQQQHQEQLYTIVDLISLGRIQQEISSDNQNNYTNNNKRTARITKKTKENVTVFAVILAAVIPTNQTIESTSNHNSKGQVLIGFATRTYIKIQRQISIGNDYTDFVPSCAIHPATYINKIVIGGSINNKMAAILLNIRTGKVIHFFHCLQVKSVSNKSQNRNNFSTRITTMEQSPAIDTIAMGTNRGIVYLINIKHDQILFQLKHTMRKQISTNKANTINMNNELQSYMTLGNKSNTDNDDVTITSISFRTDGAATRYGMAPMAVGRSDGNITIWDLTPPQQISNNDDDDGPIPVVHPLGRTVLCEMNQVHVGGVAKIQYFPQEPILLSTGTTSNSIIMHIFDSPDHSGRILRQRKGHRSPPTYIRYLHPGAGAGNGILANMSDGTDASSCQIISSGGQDRTIRVFSTVRSVLDKEYSQGRGIEKKARQIGLDSTAELLLPPLVGMAMCEARTREWGDMVTIHENHSFAYVWSTTRGAQCGPVLRQLHWNVSAMKRPPNPETNASSVTISSCGNFALIGTKGGIIYRYNMQSGIARGSYPRSATTTDDDDRYMKKKEKTIGDVNRTMKALEKTLKTNTRSSNLDKTLIDAEESVKHERMLTNKLRHASHSGYPVTGLSVDILNKTLLSVGMDAKLIIWNFITQTPHQKCPIQLPAPATKLCHVRESDLAAIALNDYSILLFDCSSLYVVRRFGISSPNDTVHHKHTASITDLCFSLDGRSLYSSSMDSTIRVWDVPTNKCVDWLAFKAPPTSLTMSPTGQYLATTHVGKVGIHLWSDKSFYETVHIDGVELNHPAYMDESIQRDAPTNTSESAEVNMIPTDDTDDNSVGVPVKAKAKGLITLSGLPVAHWKNLFHLELVRQRNKPIEPPKKPPSAPFFLQWRGEQVPPSTEVVPSPAVEGEVEEEWAAAWSDDEENDASPVDAKLDEWKHEDELVDAKETKRPKITHFRSHIATLLQECNTNGTKMESLRYQPVTEYIATLGPSAIDVELSSLCNGLHDLDEGIPLLLLTTEWLLEACQSRERFEAINSYLHRFLFLHSITIASMESGTSTQTKDDNNLHPLVEPYASDRLEDCDRLLKSIAQLKTAQQSANDDLRVKMDHTLCLLRHFSRMI